MKRTGILECFLFCVEQRGSEQQTLEEGTIFSMANKNQKRALRGSSCAPHNVQDLSFPY